MPDVTHLLSEQHHGENRPKRILIEGEVSKSNSVHKNDCEPRISALLLRWKISICNHSFQWRILDFPEGIPALKWVGVGRGANLLFGQIFLKTASKIKENWTERGNACPKFYDVDPPLYLLFLFFWSNFCFSVACMTLNSRLRSKLSMENLG